MGFISVKCPDCGADIQLDDSREFGFCNYCGAKVVQDKVVVEHTGSVTVDQSAKLNNLLTLARRARDDDNTEKAAQYYDQALQEDPNNWEAYFFSVYYQASECKIAYIVTAANRVTNCEDTTLRLMEQSVTDETERIQTIEDLMKQLFLICTVMVTSAKTHFYDINADYRYRYAHEYFDRLTAACQMLYTFGDLVIDRFGESYGSLIEPCWELANGILFGSLYQKFPFAYSHDLLKVRMPKIKEQLIVYGEKAHQYKPEYKPELTRTANTNTASSSGCYVATCVYGSYDCPQVWTLRRYRDDTLAYTWYGRAFIRTYYAVSPTLVAWFGHTDWFKKLWRGKLDRMVESLQRDGVKNTPYEDKKW